MISASWRRSEDAKRGRHEWTRRVDDNSCNKVFRLSPLTSEARVDGMASGVSKLSEPLRSQVMDVLVPAVAGAREWYSN